MSVAASIDNAPCALCAALRRIVGGALPVLAIVTLIVAIWYLAAIGMNRAWTLDQAQRTGVALSQAEVIADTMSQERPVLPAPHQVAA